MRQLFVRRPDTASLTLLMLLAGALWLPRLRGPLDLRYDAGVYYILGTSLVEGRGYRLLNEPGEIQAIQYPPLLPLIAAAHQWAAGGSDSAKAGHWLRVSFALCFVAYVLAAYRLNRRYLGPGVAGLAALVVLLHVSTLWYSELFFAELPFGLVTLLFLLAAGSPTPRVHTWLAGALAAAAYLLRTAGIAVLAAWVAESVIRRQWRAAGLRAAMALLPVLVWQGYIAQVKRGAEYSRPAYPYQRAAYQYHNVGYLDNVAFVDPFTPERGRISPLVLGTRLVGNLVRMPTIWGEAVTSRAEWSVSQLERINREFSPVALPLWLVGVALSLFGAVVVAGLVLLTLRGEVLLPLYVAGSVVLVCLTPWPAQYGRYLAPLTPLFALAMFVALAALRQRLARAASQRRRRLGAVVIGATLLGVFGQETFVLYKVYTKQHRPAVYPDRDGGCHAYRLFFYPHSWRLHDGALDWLARQAKAGEIIVTSTPQWAYLRTGLQAVMPPFEPDVGEAQRLLDAVPATYVVVDSLEFVDITRRYAAPVVRAFPERWRLIYATPDSVSRIYRHSNPGGTPGSR